MNTYTTSQPQSQSQQQLQRVKVVAGYALQQRLGSGSFATVYKGVLVPPNLLQNQQQQAQQQQQQQDNNNEKPTNPNNNMPDVVAIKAIARTSEKLTKKVLQNLEIEINILRTYQHPNIVCMHNVQKTDRHFYLILEYCGGGDVQRLIRTRRSGRISERLTRRLMRDLAAGLKFLWGQELIHRDIKPQNLLLTGALPLDEVNDPDSTPEEEERRRQINFPSEQFSLKIADFGFARHLQSASLAETLCGSPLYMAPEILQHHRYDAKADLWSVGTVLFEMIAGKPPFNGENHIDLLRNIQRKAVRLPPDVRVSKACVNLLRLLLNRNPLSRAGFKEFFEACDAFVQLGCEGVATKDTAGSRRIPGSNDLGTIPENENGNGGSSSGGGSSPNSSSAAPPSESLMTVDTTAQQQLPEREEQLQIPNPANQQTLVQQPQSNSRTYLSNAGANIVSPLLAPSTPTSLVPNVSLYEPRTYPASTGTTAIRTRLSPLTQSPPSSGQIYNNNRLLAPLPSLGTPAISSTGHGMPQSQVPTDTSTYQTSTNAVQSNSVSHSQASSAGDDSEFVMVEHNIGTSSSGMRSRISPNSSQHYYVTSSGQAGTRGNTNYVNITSAGMKGMLSTSPGTGKLLMGMMGMAPASISKKEYTKEKIDDEVAAAGKMIATAEDVGRRAVSVAHLGDTRAYFGMRLIFRNTEGGSSLLSATPMEGVEEEPDDDYRGDSVEHGSTEIMVPARRRSSTLSDKHMAEDDADDNFAEEMPFALSPDPPAVSLPSRSNMSAHNRSTTSILSMKRSNAKAEPQHIRASFGEALSCYLKALKMLKGAVGAAQRVSRDLERLEAQLGRNALNADIPKMKRRCEVTGNWLCTQFRGVLERADAANMEISKLAAVHQNEQSLHGKSFEPAPVTSVTSVEELIYNHSLASGRDGAVKHLLGQYEAARSCYRSAGLLAETLLMEATVEGEDRKVLEGYVDSFAARITELDQLMLHQGRTPVTSSNANIVSVSGLSSRRGSGVVGVIGPSPSSAPTGFLVGPS